MDRTKRPQDVNEALSSMLWTPYNRTPSVSSDDSESATPINHSSHFHMPHQYLHQHAATTTTTTTAMTAIQHRSMVPSGVRAALTTADAGKSCYIEQASQRYCNSILVPVNNVPPYFMKQYNNASNDNRMVHSFTDNFLPFHIENSEHIYYQEQQQQQQQQQQQHKTAKIQQINRFSNDFTCYDTSTGSSSSLSNQSTTIDSSLCATSILPPPLNNENVTVIDENQCNNNNGGVNSENDEDKINSSDEADEADDDNDDDDNGDYGDILRYQSPKNNSSNLVYVQSHHSDYSPTNRYHHHNSNSNNNSSDNNDNNNSNHMNNECTESSTSSHINVNVNYYRTVPVKIITNNFNENEICEINCNNNNNNNNSNNNSHSVHNNNNSNHSDNGIDSINCNNRNDISNLVLQKKIHITQSSHRNFTQNDFDMIHSQWIPAAYHNLSVVNHPFVLSPMVSTISVMPTISVPVHRPPSEISSKGCCGRWFAGPPLRALIAVVALGGLACAIGGAAVGITGLSGPPASHLTAALLMIGVGVILVTVSGAAWHMTSPSMTTCFGGLGFSTAHDLNLNNMHHHNDTLLQYSEFQHRSPPPSYHASMQEYRLRLLLMERDRQPTTNHMATTINREISPPPAYNNYMGTGTTITNENTSNNSYQMTEYMKNDLFPS